MERSASLHPASSATTEGPSLVSHVPDPIDSARAAKLRYVHDDDPGIRRIKRGKAFRYTDPDGNKLSDARELARIRSLGIPPAWTSVWICTSPLGHIQATGRDARGRKQYRYHTRWREVRDETKYGKMLDFGQALPGIRARTEQDLTLKGLPRNKVLATVVALLELTFIRVGNEEYARKNGSFGLTTLQSRHVDIHGADITFRFRGKSGKEHVIGVHDRRLSRIVGACDELPGQELFQYLDEDGAQHSISSSDVNDYLREASGHDFTAKDFRTWAGTVLALSLLSDLPSSETATQRKKNMVDVIKQVASRLGNTPAVCKRCYVHPAVLSTYMTGESLAEKIAEAQALERMSELEARVMGFLRALTATSAAPSSAATPSKSSTSSKASKSSKATTSSRSSGSPKLRHLSKPTRSSRARRSSGATPSSVRTRTPVAA